MLRDSGLLDQFLAAEAEGGEVVLWTGGGGGAASACSRRRAPHVPATLACPRRHRAPAPPSRARAAIAYPRSVAGNSAIPGVLAWQARARLSRSEQPLTQADSAGNLSLEGSLAGLGRGGRGNHGSGFTRPGVTWARLGHLARNYVDPALLGRVPACLYVRRAPACLYVAVSHCGHGLGGRFQ